jgi:23S rRNA (cytidine1920-2'-O)/16S rRNA (cytidine1409-2'-O)-methyltransferase
MDQKIRLDQALVESKLVISRSQAESYIKLGLVRLNKKVITKPGHLIKEEDKSAIHLDVKTQYVNRAALKLESVAKALSLDFNHKTVLDVGSSTGGFTDFALKHGAEKVLAVDSGSNQLHPSLRGNPNIELHEKTDIRDFKPNIDIDIVLIDVSFISLREIMPTVYRLSNSKTQVVPMVKPQFEAWQSNFKHKGVIKNDKIRREILKDFEVWVKQSFAIMNKQDSDTLLSPSKGLSS